jgi:hypothetical protein
MNDSARRLRQNERLAQFSDMPAWVSIPHRHASGNRHHPVISSRQSADWRRQFAVSRCQPWFDGHVRKFVFRGFGYVLVWGCFFD